MTPDIIEDLAAAIARHTARRIPLAHGVSRRVDKLRAYGNAIVPQVAESFIRAYLESGGAENRLKWADLPTQG